MRVVYSGCRYNSITFAVGDQEDLFQVWLMNIQYELAQAVNDNPTKFKFSGRGSPIFTQSLTITNPVSDQDYIPPVMMRCRLAIERLGPDINDTRITTTFQDLEGSAVEPGNIYGGGYILPIFKVSYYKQGPEYGVQLTLIKGIYEAPPDTRVSNEDWMYTSDPQ